MGQIHGMEKLLTITEVAETYGRKPDTLWRKAKKVLPPPPGGKWSLHSAVTEEEGRILLGDWPAPVPAKPRKQKTIIRTPAQHTVHQPAPAINEAIPPAPGRAKPTWILYVLLIGPIVASWHNMYLITHDLSGTVYDAVALTAVLSFSAIGFVWYGVRRWYIMALAGFLIAYESFCNLTRIYGGLMGSGTSTGNPTRFVGLVTDIFGTGTHGTAIFLGAFTAFFIAAVQYAAVFELNKSK